MVLLALYRYAAYANTLLLDVVGQLDDDQFSHVGGPLNLSVQGILRHMLATETYFLRACQRVSFERGDPQTLDAIHQAWAALESETQAYIESIPADALMEVVDVTINEHPFRFARWQLLMQGMLHAMQHRGELSILLTEIGHPLPTMDIIIQFAEESGQGWPWKSQS